MKKQLVVNTLIIMLCFGILTVLVQKNSQAETASFSQIVPFTTVGGNICFFDQNTGMVYIYSDTMEKLVFQYQLQELGEPGAKIFSEDTVRIKTYQDKNDVGTYK